MVSIGRENFTCLQWIDSTRRCPKEKGKRLVTAGRHGSAPGGSSEEQKEKNRRSETAPSSPRLLGIGRSKSFPAVQRWTEPGKLRAPGGVDREEGKQRNRAEGRERKRFRGSPRSSMSGPRGMKEGCHSAISRHHLALHPANRLLSRSHLPLSLYLASSPFRLRNSRLPPPSPPPPPPAAAPAGTTGPSRAFSSANRLLAGKRDAEKECDLRNLYASVVRALGLSGISVLLVLYFCNSALDEVTDPQNLGAIIRSAYFFGASGVVLCAKNSAPLSGVVSKASAGSLELMELRYCKNMMQFLTSSAENGWRVLGGSVSSKSVPLNDISPGVPTILVLGSEGTGLRPLVERSCTELIRIPGNISSDVTAGEANNAEEGIETNNSAEEFRSFLAVESLNVSVAAGVLLHHLIGSNYSTEPCVANELTD
ncbi:hypothetical protein NL676_038650 [Syzygium grande]|nr:hypothetical protein NL676_038650 [Syzygium grande]